MVKDTNNSIKIKFKRLDKLAKTPSQAYPWDAGFDLTAVNYKYDAEHDYHCYGTGLAVEIPEGYVGLIFPRSSNRNTDSYMCNHVGIIDAGYRGEIFITFKNRDSNNASSPYGINSKPIAQLVIMPIPTIEFEEVKTLTDSVRGDKGHGSSSK